MCHKCHHKPGRREICLSLLDCKPHHICCVCTCSCHEPLESSGNVLSQIQVSKPHWYYGYISTSWRGQEYVTYILIRDSACNVALWRSIFVSRSFFTWAMTHLLLLLSPWCILVWVDSVSWCQLYFMLYMCCLLFVWCTLIVLFYTAPGSSGSLRQGWEAIY